MLNRHLSLVFLGWIVLACGVQATAQSITSGDVTGVVTDPAHAAVPNASVTLTNVNTNVVQTATTGSQGTYRFAFTQPGTYKVSFPQVDLGRKSEEGSL